MTFRACSHVSHMKFLFTNSLHLLCSASEWGACPRVGWVAVACTLSAGWQWKRKRGLWCGHLLCLALPHNSIAILLFVESYQLQLVQPSKVAGRPWGHSSSTQLAHDPPKPRTIHPTGLAHIASLSSSAARPDVPSLSFMAPWWAVTICLIFCSLLSLVEFVSRDLGGVRSAAAMIPPGTLYLSLSSNLQGPRGLRAEEDMGTRGSEWGVKCSGSWAGAGQGRGTNPSTWRQASCFQVDFRASTYSWSPLALVQHGKSKAWTSSPLWTKNRQCTPLVQACWLAKDTKQYLVSGALTAVLG